MGSELNSKRITSWTTVNWVIARSANPYTPVLPVSSVNITFDSFRRLWLCWSVGETAGIHTGQQSKRFACWPDHVLLSFAFRSGVFRLIIITRKQLLSSFCKSVWNLSISKWFYMNHGKHTPSSKGRVFIYKPLSFRYANNISADILVLCCAKREVTNY